MSAHTPTSEIPVTTSPIKRVLIAEDHDDFRELLTEAFEEAGYNVTQCANGKALYDALSLEDRKDLVAIVSDHRMPGMEGLEVLERLRGKRPKAPFILVTAFGEHEVHRRGKELGSDLVVNKPLDEDALVASVSCMIGAA